MAQGSRFDRFRQETVAGSVYTKGVEYRMAFIKKVYLYFGLSLGFALIGAIVAMQGSMAYTVAKNSMLFFILEIASLIGVFFLRKVKPINMILFFTFTFLSGLTLGPLLYTYQITGNFHLVLNAFALATIAFSGLTAYAWTTKKDFSYLSGFLWMGIFLLIGGMILNYFMAIPMLSTVISMGGVVLFSMFILYDTQNIIRRYDEDEYMIGAVALFIDFLNLFLFILSLLSNDR